MPRSHIVLLSLFTAIALSQTPVVGQQAAVVSGVALVAAPLGADDVVARMLSFDRNHDGRLEVGELPDRMQNLFDRGDTGRDGALDRTEIQRLATTPTATPPPASAVTTRGVPRTGGYTFGDQAGFSTRSHVDEALGDLMLASPEKEKAQAIATKFVADLQLTANADLLKEMEPLLSPGQLTAFRSMLERQNGGRIFIAPPQNNVSGTARVVFFGMDLQRRVESFGLPATQRRNALAAIERFNDRLRPGEAERVSLLASMKGVMSDEERDNFRAALERRPIVKAGLPGVVSSVVPGVVSGFAGDVERIRGIQRNLILDKAAADAVVVVR